MHTKEFILAALLIVIVFIVMTTPAICQIRVPVIRANDPLVDIRDGGELRKGQWRISPHLTPDVYKTHAKNEPVTFITDIDSISCVVGTDTPFTFVILFQGKDSALTEVRYEPTYLEVLIGGGPYAKDPARTTIPFLYRSADTPELRSLRSRFALDSIAGHGPDDVRVINILHWVHTTFPHDGTKDAPASSGTGDLMGKCIADSNATVDCGSLATILADCYTALGFRARRVVCLPKDSTDNDCHSINAVYLPGIGRWVWMDPTNDAYVRDEQGQLLGIGDVRQRLIENRPLRLNEDANWNHRSPVTAARYLYNYMAKNLFALLYYGKTEEGSRPVLLTPASFPGAIPRTRAAAPVCTHDPEVFWGK